MRKKQHRQERMLRRKEAAGLLLLASATVAGCGVGRGLWLVEVTRDGPRTVVSAPDTGPVFPAS